jgi:ribonucleoside-diphosphate reductase alpha chain
MNINKVIIMGEYEDRLIKERYCANGESSWTDIVRRVVDAICKTESDKKEMFEIINNKDFIPNTPTLMNAGTKSGQLSACFALNIEDSIDSIFDANKHAAGIFKSGGGVGFDFSKIRASGSRVGDRKGVASGVVSFMRVFDTMTDVIKQGGSRFNGAV